MEEEKEVLRFQDEINEIMEEAVELCESYRVPQFGSIFYGISGIFWHSPEQVKILADSIQAQIMEISKNLKKELKGK